MNYLELGYDEYLQRPFKEGISDRTTTLSNEGMLEDVAVGAFGGTIEDMIKTGRINDILKLGGDKVTLDGKNGRIVVNDGENERVWIGNLD